MERKAFTLATALTLIATGTLMITSGISGGAVAGIGMSTAERWPLFLFLCLLSLLAALIILGGLECLQWLFTHHVRYYGLFSRGWRGMLHDLGMMVMATCLLLTSVSYQRLDTPVCGGGLSAGFPLAFVCNDGGGSPLSSANQIDQDDAANVHHLALYINLLVYLTLVWSGKTALYKVLRNKEPTLG
jgi:hypothetical protein